MNKGCVHRRTVVFLCIIDWLAVRRWWVRVLLANGLAGGAPALFLLTPSTMASGAMLGASRMRTLARKDDEEDFRLLGNNLFVC